MFCLWRLGPQGPWLYDRCRRWYKERRSVLINMATWQETLHRLGEEAAVEVVPIAQNSPPRLPWLYLVWSLTSLCHSNGHIETMPAREINPFTALTRIRSQFLRTQWSTSNHQRVDTTTPQTAEPSGLAPRDCTKRGGGTKRGGQEYYGLVVVTPASAASAAASADISSFSR